MGVIMKHKINYSGISAGGGGGLPGIGYSGSDLILRDANGDISGLWYVDGDGNWVEYTTGGGGSDSGHTFGPMVFNAASIIFNTTSYEEVPIE